MIARRLGAAALVLMLAGWLAGCGSTQAQRTPTVSSLPLVPGSKIVAQVRSCDRGSNAFCGIDLVVRNGNYKSSDVFARDESHVLRKDGWSPADGDTDMQSAANSPRHKLRLTYATATGDLREIVLGIINRPWPITYALSNSMFDRDAAISMRLQVGAS